MNFVTSHFLKKVSIQIFFAEFLSFKFQKFGSHNTKAKDKEVNIAVT
jgi:hypothetical protein